SPDCRIAHGWGTASARRIGFQQTPCRHRGYRDLRREPRADGNIHPFFLQRQLAGAAVRLLGFTFPIRTMSDPAKNPTTPAHRHALSAIFQWFDSDYTPGGADNMRNEPDKVDWVRCIPFIVLHAGCLGVIWVGASAFAVWTAVALYVMRMFAVTGIY